MNLSPGLNFNIKTARLEVGRGPKGNPGGTKSYAGTSSAWNPSQVTTPAVTVDYRAPSACRQAASLFSSSKTNCSSPTGDFFTVSHHVRNTLVRIHGGPIGKCASLLRVAHPFKLN